jgi:hypothetical protein
MVSTRTTGLAKAGTRPRKSGISRGGIIADASSTRTSIQRNDPFRKVYGVRDWANMLQINNILHALEEAKHSLDQIIESAMDLPQCHG